MNAPLVAFGPSASITADGGKGGAGIQHANSLGFGGGGGAGGRIKVTAQTYAPQGGPVRASGGAGGTAPATYQGKVGGNGTVSVPPTP
jgi:hypothetical protein